MIFNSNIDIQLEADVKRLRQKANPLFEWTLHIIVWEDGCYQVWIEHNDIHQGCKVAFFIDRPNWPIRAFVGAI